MGMRAGGTCSPLAKLKLIIGQVSSLTSQVCKSIHLFKIVCKVPSRPNRRLFCIPPVMKALLLAALGCKSIGSGQYISRIGAMLRFLYTIAGLYVYFHDVNRKIKVPPEAAYAYEAPGTIRCTIINLIMSSKV